MSNSEKPLTEKESLDLIAQMIAQAKQSYYDTGLSAMMWGLVIAVCSLVRLSEIQFKYELPVDIYWLTFVAIIPQVLISIRESKERKVRTYDDIYMDYLWLAFGISIFLLIFIINAIFHAWPGVATDPIVTGESRKPGFYEFVAPLFLLLYGIPTFITGAACKFRPMLIGGLLCWICCIITIYTTIKIDLVLTAFSAIAAWFIPGIVMQKEYRRAKRELAPADV
ncbi:MAG TPA: hypothetical protein VMZ03_06805 [Chitinophagaceae bacterium]|nr:hypothetical protein [Chitinophagaceae bacterium]